ncbi:MAG: cohesin domain-containing protein, partial [Candidatus Azambacteria bacterium]|nr:cohesin domain-containing protein [Candidatus Azambacteria bacterium]
MEKTQKIKFLISFVFVAVVFIALSSTASAATLYFSPSSGSYTVGTTLSVSVYVSSADQAMNAASGIISFPQDKLEVTSLSKTGSIFTLWVQEPSFLNSAGTVNFEGIVLNPGFTGASGKVITINFRVKAGGTTLLNFFSGSALANDGKGTNILANLGNAQFSLGGASPTVPEATTPSAISGAPSAPVISSPTHPDPNKWYAQKDAKFTWTVPSGVSGVRLLVGKLPAAIPTVTYVPAISEKEVTNFGDGIWYFHAQFRNANGWGEISHFRFQIDTQPPESFSIKFIDGNETENPRPTVVFDTTDSLSGVNYYKIKIGEGDFFPIAPEIVKNNPYTLPLQNPGKRNILIQAFDKAENYSVATEEFVIKPLQAPVFTEYPKELQSGEILKVSGESKYPNSQIVIGLQREKDEPKSFTVESDRDGKFTFTADEKLRDGIYQLWAEVVDGRGARSLPSEKITIVAAKPAILRVGSWAVGLLAVVVPLIALIIALLFILWYGWHKFSLLRKRLRKEVREAESALHKAFDLLKENVR